MGSGGLTGCRLVAAVLLTRDSSWHRGELLYYIEGSGGKATRVFAQPIKSGRCTCLISSLKKDDIWRV